MDKLLAEAKNGEYNGRKIGKMDKSDLMKALYKVAGTKEKIDPETEKWKEAEEHITNIRKMYNDIGVSGIPALTATINPLLVRLMKDERTDELYEAIMSLK